MENSTEVILNTKNWATIWFRRLIPGNISQKDENSNSKKIHATQYSLKHYVSIQQPRHENNSSAYQQTTGLRRCVCIHIYTHTHTHTRIHTVEYYSAIRVNQTLSFVAT